MTFTTKRLILRPWREEDAEDIYPYASDPEVGPSAGWRVHTSVENSREIIRNVLCVPETYALCLKENGKPIGSIGLHRNDFACHSDEYELGYWIGKPFWGQGLVPEAAREILRHAFEDLGMQRIFCGYYDGNVKSRRVQEKLGFVYHHTTEGIELLQLSEIRTGHVMLMTRERWETLCDPLAHREGHGGTDALDGGKASEKEMRNGPPCHAGFCRQSVYQLLVTIPHGKVVTYGTLAAMLGNRALARAVGNALHTNPDGERYPCYKVVNRKGELSPAYAFGGIEEQKRRLLAEGIEVKNGKVDLEKYGYGE